MFRARGFSAPPPPFHILSVAVNKGFVDTDSSGDKFGLKGLIAHNFAPQLGSELERLFLPDIGPGAVPMCLSLPSRPFSASAGGSAASSPGSISPWDEFRTNGRDQDLDELDRLVRGMEVTSPPEPEDDDMDMILPGLPVYPALSTSPGSDSSESSADSYGILSTTNTIMSKARLLEILRERERDRLARRRQKVKGDKICVFCRNNGESEAVYSTHQLKDAQGRVTCPVLYIYTCPICGASGESAHTIKYCPLNPHDKKAKNPCKSPRNSVGRTRPQITLQGLFKHFHSP